MSAFRIRTAALTVAAAIGLSACMSPYGYGGTSVGVGVGSGYGSYGYGYPGYGYGGYGYDPYWGWYDGYYYPGTGYYVYDRYRRPFPWDRYKDYWEGRRERAMSTREFRRQMEEQRAAQNQPNWSAFEQAPTRVKRVRQGDNRSSRVERTRPSRSERASSRSSRSERASSRSSSNRQSASEFRRAQEANRDD